MKSDLLLTNGKFYIDGKLTDSVTSIYLRNSLIENILQKSDTQPNDVMQIDMKQKAIYPGFIDTHTHSFEGGLYSGGVDLGACRSIAEIQELLSAHIDKHPGSDTLFCWRFDENQIEEHRFPLTHELDAVAPSRPLIVRRIDGHSCVVNGNLCEFLKVPRDYIFRGDENDRVVHYLHGNLSEQEILKAYDKASQIALAGGFTSIHTMIGDANRSLTHYRLIRDNLRRFPIDYNIYPQCFDIEAALELGATRIGGCILADGSFGSYTAAISQNYLHTDKNGVLYKSNDFWDSFITEAHKHDLQVAVHCIGDRAIRQINDVYLKLAQTDPKDLRHELIHMELTPLDLLDKIAESGAQAVMQPAFDRYWGGEEGFYESVLGASRSREMNRFRHAIDMNINLCFGSDWYITELDALNGIYSAVEHHNPLERITFAEAIAAYTINAARLSHEETTKGHIKKGYQADLTILDKPLDQGTYSDQPKVVATIKNGELVYGDL